MRLPWWAGLAGLVATLVFVISAAGSPALQFQVFARTGLRLTDIVWTGHQFLYVDNTTNRVFAAGPSGLPMRLFARMPREVEETRCAISLGGHGFPAGQIYCVSPTNRIYRISPDGKRVKVWAVLPHSPRSDGAVTFDTSGRFGYDLLAATGRSGSPSARGGKVFRVDPQGRVRRVGTYANPGGADEIAVAPPRFGTASGQILLAVDAGSTGSLVAMDAQGHDHTLARLPDGPNPIVALTSGQNPPASTAKPGLYVTDTTSHIVYLVTASELRGYTGAVIVGSERRGLFWMVRPQGRGFAIQRLATTLSGKHYSLEAATYITNRG